MTAIEQKFYDALEAERFAQIERQRACDRVRRSIIDWTSASLRPMSMTEDMFYTAFPPDDNSIDGKLKSMMSSRDPETHEEVLAIFCRTYMVTHWVSFDADRLHFFKSKFAK